jgi:hypothetical protein
VLVEGDTGEEERVKRRILKMTKIVMIVCIKELLA